MSEAVKNAPKGPRPRFTNIHVLDLMNYRLPPPGIVSILHRISGALLFLALPVILYMFEQSLVWEKFGAMREVASHWFVKLVILALAWGYLQHFCAGVRHLFMDLHMGLDKDSARKSAATVLVISLLLTALVGLKLFGVF